MWTQFITAHFLKVTSIYKVRFREQKRIQTLSFMKIKRTWIFFIGCKLKVCAKSYRADLKPIKGSKPDNELDLLWFYFTFKRGMKHESQIISLSHWHPAVTGSTVNNSIFKPPAGFKLIVSKVKHVTQKSLTLRQTDNI